MLLKAMSQGTMVKMRVALEISTRDQNHSETYSYSRAAPEIGRLPVVTSVCVFIYTCSWSVGVETFILEVPRWVYS